MSDELTIWAAIQDDYALTEVAYFTSEEDAKRFAGIEKDNGNPTWVESRTVNHPQAMRLIQTGESHWLYVNRSNGQVWVCYESFTPSGTGSETQWWRYPVVATTEQEALAKGNAIYAESGHSWSTTR